MKQCLIVLLSYLLITQQSRSNYLVSYEKLYELPNLLSKYLGIQMDDNRLGATGPAGMLSVLSQPGEQQHPQRAARVGSPHGGSCTPWWKAIYLSEAGKQTKKPSPSQTQKWEWPFVSTFSFIFCSSVSVLSIPHIFNLHLLFSLSLDPLQALQENAQKGVYFQWLRLRCHGHEQPE